MSNTELITALEAAEGPSRDMDCLIHEAQGNVVDHAYAEMHSAEETPFYTASIDAALTLVPKGYCVSTMGEVPDDLEWFVELWSEGSLTAEPETRAKNPAIALCIAAILAKLETVDAN